MHRFDLPRIFAKHLKRKNFVRFLQQYFVLEKLRNISLFAVMEKMESTCNVTSMKF